MKHAFRLAALAALAASPAGAGTDAANLAAARAYVLAALPGQCDEAPLPGGDSSLSDTAYRLSWKAAWSGEGDPDETATLYQIFCMAGAYNLVHAYALQPDGGSLSLVSFAEPAFSYAYADGDESFATLKEPPRVTGFATVLTLVNSEFDAASGTLSSYAKWRGLGDAWSAGSWRFSEGRFVLSSYAVDPTYDANLDTPSDAQIDQFFKLYP